MEGWNDSDGFEEVRTDADGFDSACIKVTLNNPVIVNTAKNNKCFMKEFFVLYETCNR